jgi:succinyl-CoA synthetase beta subunit
MRCDVIAKGVVAAVREMGLALPVVVRLEGTNVDEGKRILRESGLAVTPAEGLADGARKAVAAAGAAR